MGQQSIERAAEIIRRIADDIEKEAERLGQHVKKKDIAAALDMDPTLLSHVRGGKKEGVALVTVSRASRATGIPAEVFIDDELPIELYRQHMAGVRTRIGLPQKGAAMDDASHDGQVPENNSPRAEVFGLESLAGMEKQIEGVVEHLGLDMRGRHYVISALRVEAMEGRLADRWAALARAAHHARQYEAAS